MITPSQSQLAYAPLFFDDVHYPLNYTSLIFNGELRKKIILVPKAKTRVSLRVACYQANIENLIQEEYLSTWSTSLLIKLATQKLKLLTK